MKARHFVLALHDHFSEKYSKLSSPNNHTEEVPQPQPSRSSESPILAGAKPLDGSITQSLSVMDRQNEDDDKWAMKYISLSYIQPILEAFDDDGSGFISIKEVNDFTNSRPKNWRCVSRHWPSFAVNPVFVVIGQSSALDCLLGCRSVSNRFGAELKISDDNSHHTGWYSTIWDYRFKIYCIIETMFQRLRLVPPVNRGIVDMYLGSEAFKQVELLLRPIHPVRGGRFLLDERILPYVREEESRMRDSLVSLEYEIDAHNTLSFITGPGRIDRVSANLVNIN